MQPLIIFYPSTLALFPTGLSLDQEDIKFSVVPHT